MKKLLSLILTGVIVVSMVGCRRDITKPLTDAEQTLVNEWSRIEEDLNSCNVSSIEDTIEDLDEQVELLEEEQDYFKKDDTEYKAIDVLIDVFETANKVLEISVNFIKNPMSALVVGDTIEQQIEEYSDKVQDSLEKYKEYKKELGIVTNVDLSKIGNKEDNSQENNTKEKQKTAVEDNTKVETSKQETKQTTNKQTNNTKKNSNNTNNSNNSNTNNDSTCDFCGTSSNSVQWRGNYRLCYSCYQGVVNSAEGDHKLYEEYIDDSNEDNNNLNNDRDNSQYDNSDNTDE